MATLSSHLLNSVNGTHASGVKVIINQINSSGEKEIFFQSETDNGGRILKDFDIPKDMNEIIEPFVGNGDLLNFIKEKVRLIRPKPKVKNAELVDKAKYYISHQEEARKIADRGFTKLLKYHTTTARANEFLSLIEQYL